MIDQSDILRLKVLVKEISDILSKSDAEQPDPVEPVEPAKSITSLVIENTGGNQKDVPFSFGHPFAVGHFKPDQGLAGRLENGDMVPLQVDVKALHDDGSVRHAIVSGILPTLFKDEKRKLNLVTVKAGTMSNQEVTPTTSLALVVRVDIGGKHYTIEQPVGNPWRNGEIVQELSGLVPLQDADNKPHPHLAARIGLSMYNTDQTRFEIVIENNWAYEPNPQNFTYDVSIEVGGKPVYEQKDFVHYHHARWRKVFWLGEEPSINIQHDKAYVIDTMAIPNYDLSFEVPEKTLAEWSKKWDKAGKGPMQVGLSVKGMATTGGRPDIGIIPAWGVLWLLTGDALMAEMTLGTAESAGSWSMHYRDKNTGQPISLIDYPYMTILGRAGDTMNPATKQREAFPVIAKADAKTPYSHDSSHQPGFAYLPYLLTGEYYHLEELQFWAMWDVFSTNPGYRKNVQGLLWRQQVRAIAWSLRTLAQVAYITPDDDRLKGHFLQILKSNIDYGIETFVKPETANKLGIFTGPGAVVYQGATAIGTFQDEHLTSAIAYVVDLGFADAEPLLEWKAKFAIERLTGEGTNWLASVSYAWPVRATEDGEEFTTIKQAYEKLIKEADTATLARLNNGGSDLGGYPTSTEGFAANLQPAAAAAARYNPQAWEQFEKRSPKPNYGTGPQFAIRPWSA